MNNLRGSKNSIARRNMRTIHGVFHRDYADYFFEWYFKRYGYVDDILFERFLDKQRKLISPYMYAGAGQPQKPWKQEWRRVANGMAEGDFCTVNVRKQLDISPCVFCKTKTYIYEEQHYVISVDEGGYKLQDYWDFDATRYSPISIKSQYHERSKRAIPIHKTIINLKCQKAACQEVNMWLNNDSNLEVLAKAKELKVKAMRPTKKTLEKVTPEYMGAFLAARYLDYQARYIERKN